jgi:hypothetical protein
VRRTTALNGMRSQLLMESSRWSNTRARREQHVGENSAQNTEHNFAAALHGELRRQRQAQLCVAHEDKEEVDKAWSALVRRTTALNGMRSQLLMERTACRRE